MPQPEDIAQSRTQQQSDYEECASLGDSNQRYDDQSDHARKAHWVPGPLTRAQMAEGHNMPRAPVRLSELSA